MCRRMESVPQISYAVQLLNELTVSPWRVPESRVPIRITSPVFAGWPRPKHALLLQQISTVTLTQQVNRARRLLYIVGQADELEVVGCKTSCRRRREVLAPSGEQLLKGCLAARWMGQRTQPPGMTKEIEEPRFHEGVTEVKPVSTRGFRREAPGVHPIKCCDHFLQLKSNSTLLRHPLPRSSPATFTRRTQPWNTKGQRRTCRGPRKPWRGPDGIAGAASLGDQASRSPCAHESFGASKRRPPPLAFGFGLAPPGRLPSATESAASSDAWVPRLSSLTRDLA